MKKASQLVEDIINRANRLNESIILEATLRDYLTHQVSVAQAVAKSLNTTADDLFINTKFPVLYANVVDRDKDSLPSINSVANKLIAKLKV